MTARPGSKVIHLCCSAHIFFFLPILQAHRQLEPPLSLNFSCPIFRKSALAQNFSIDLLCGKVDRGSLVHSRECGKATAVSGISSTPTSSPKFEMWFLALEFVISCTVAKCFFTAAEDVRTINSTSFSL